MDTLTPAEEETIHQFISITSYRLPAHTAIPYLQASDWNLERAIIMYFETTPEANEQLNSNARRVVFPGNFPGDNSLNTATDNGNVPSTSASASASASGSRPQSNGSASNGVQSAISDFFDSIKRKIASIGGAPGQYLPLSNNGFATSRTFVSLSPKSKAVYIIQLVLYLPVFIIHKITLLVFFILSKLFPVVNRLTTRYSQNRNGSRSEPKGVDPSQIARNFISDFNLYHHNDNRLEFYEGGYTSALYIAKRDARFMCVYLHSEENDNTNEFIDATLLNDKVLKFFKEHNVLVWGGNVVESEAYQVANVLGATKFPFVALLSLKSSTTETPEGTTTGSPTMSVVSRVQGVVSAEKLVDKFSSQVERLEPTLITLRSERQEQALSRLMREQQDQAYQASLARDRAIAEQRRQEEVIKRKREQWLKWRVSTLLPEPSVEDKSQYARVAIRMNSSERVQRRFAKDAYLEEIYAYVELYNKGLLNYTDDIEQVDKPEDFEYEFKFKIVSPMPRVIVEPSLVVKVQDNATVWPNGNLVVETNDNE